MKFIETVWEKENLGIESGKLVIEAADTAEDVERKLAAAGKEYLEADVEPGNYETICLLESHGFHYIETAVELKGSRAQLCVPREVRRFVGQVSYELSTQEELTVIKENIASGEMFRTDKIAQNPIFGEKKAGYRYLKWIEGLLEQDCRCYSVKYAQNLVGFEVSRKKGGEVEFLIGGGFPHAGVGTGLLTVTASYDYWTKQDISTVLTHVSSNNLPVLKLHQMFGMKVQQMRYVLICDDKLRKRFAESKGVSMSWENNA